MEGCLACEGTNDLWFAELGGTFTTEMRMEMAMCVDCGEGKFTDGKNCFDCPPGCLNCTLDLESLFYSAIENKW